MNENKVLTEKKGRDPLPEYFDTIEEIAEFWDTHSSADYPEAFGEEVEFEVDLRSSSRGLRVRVEKNLGQKLEHLAAKQDIAVETLINVWLSERLAQVTASGPPH